MRETIFSATPVEATVHQVYTWVAANGSLLITVHLGGIRVWSPPVSFGAHVLSHKHWRQNFTKRNNSVPVPAEKNMKHEDETKPPRSLVSQWGFSVRLDLPHMKTEQKSENNAFTGVLVQDK